MSAASIPLASVVEARLGVERFGPYRQAMGNNLSKALSLYEWNTRVSGAFYEDIAHLEVILRNAIHEQMTIWHAAVGRPGEWYDDPGGLLDERRHNQIAEARERIRTAGKTETPGKVVSELMFGFWRFLLDARYQPTLWAQALRFAFPGLVPPRRSDLYGPIDRLYRLRNRIAHHEPIHQADLASSHAELLTVAAWVDPQLAAWIGDNSRVQSVLARKPEPGHL